MASATQSEKEAGTSNLTAGISYDVLTSGAVQRQWYGLWDCLARFSITVGAFYFYAVTQPFSFCRFCQKYMYIWYPDRCKALAHTCAYPILPVVTLAEQTWTALKRIGAPPPTDLKTKVWFSLPPSLVPQVLYTSARSLGKMVSLFLFCGSDPEALHCSSSFLPTFLDKDFWRDLLRSAGCRVPAEVGRWDGTELHLYAPIDNKDIMLKVTRGSFGEGDQFLFNGADFKSAEDLQRLIRESTYVNNLGDVVRGYSHCGVMLLEWCRPSAELGVHSIDILTVATSAGPRVVTCMYWGECVGPSSHSTTAGYMIDVEKEEISATCPWYGPYFAQQSTRLIGQKVPGVRQACEMAMRAHSNSPYPWLTVIGWDCMVMKTGELVFFEGNFGVYRAPHRVFLTSDLLRYFLNTFEWPFMSVKPKILGGALARCQD